MNAPSGQPFPAGLSAVRRLLDDAHRTNSVYCHFKSNAHVLAGMLGDTDLDILVDRSAYFGFTGLLAAHGYRRFVTASIAAYPGVEDWIGFDGDTGKLLHLHVHWSLVLGEPNLKGYRLPWEDVVLQTRIRQSETDIYIASPEMELVLLLVRAALKHRKRTLLAIRLGRPSLQEGIEREYRWLMERADIHTVDQLAARLLSERSVTLLKPLLQNGVSDRTALLAFRKSVLRDLVPYKTFGVLAGTAKRWIREFYSKATYVLVKHFGALISRRRSPATGGAIIAFLGADGSGKSTHVKGVLKWLGWKMDVGYLYFGSGDGPVSLLRKPAMFLKRIRGRPSKAESGETHGEAFGVQAGLLKRLWRAAWAMSLVMEKRNSLKKAVRARNRGLVVVCDRYPQSQVSGFNDGPLLTEWRRLGWPWKQFAAAEARVFAMAEAVPPDLVIKLDVSEAVAMQRKSDTPPEMVARKIEAVRKLTFREPCKVVEIDADRPLDEVTLAVRHCVWNAL